MDRKQLVKALRDTAQSASNALSTNVSGPIDLIASGLRTGGIPVENPVLGAQWMAERGITVPVESGAPQVIGEALGMAAPSMAAQVPPKVLSNARKLAN